MFVENTVSKNIILRFKSFLKEKNIKFDIENTDESNYIKNLFYWENWYNFLLSCKSVLGWRRI